MSRDAERNAASNGYDARTHALDNLDVLRHGTYSSLNVRQFLHGKFQRTDGLVSVR